jgi:hypothetical protein
MGPQSTSQSGKDTSRAGTIKEALGELFPGKNFPGFAGGQTTWVGADNANAAADLAKRDVVVEFEAIDHSTGFYNTNFGTLQIGQPLIWAHTNEQIISARFHWWYPVLGGLFWLPAVSDWVQADYGKIIYWVYIEWLNGNKSELFHYDIQP